MLTLDIRPNVFKFLKTLQPKQYRQVASKIFELMHNPRLHDSILFENPWYRTDIGEYRIVYKFDDQTVSILGVGKRNDDEVYREVKRLQ